MNELKDFKEILANKCITTLFQPIVSLSTGNIIGYEALSRGPKDSIYYFPDNLFKTAMELDLLWELELLCRTTALKNAQHLDLNTKLFLNIDPNIISDNKFLEEFTMELSKHNYIAPKSIIFELTEKSLIKDLISFSTALNIYRELGCEIALDDIGSAYSNLMTLSKIKPDFIKIDMSFIRDIDSNIFNQHIITSLVLFCKNTEIKLIAEGIETPEEMKTLIDLGVYAGQGYFLMKPSEDFSDIQPYIKDLIIKYKKLQGIGVLNLAYSLAND